MAGAYEERKGGYFLAGGAAAGSRERGRRAGHFLILTMGGCLPCGMGAEGQPGHPQSGINPNPSASWWLWGRARVNLHRTVGGMLGLGRGESWAGAIFWHAPGPVVGSPDWWGSGDAGGQIP